MGLLILICPFQLKEKKIKSILDEFEKQKIQIELKLKESLVEVESEEALQLKIEKLISKITDCNETIAQLNTEYTVTNITKKLQDFTPKNSTDTAIKDKILDLLSKMDANVNQTAIKIDVLQKTVQSSSSAAAKFAMRTSETLHELIATMGNSSIQL